LSLQIALGVTKWVQKSEEKVSPMELRELKSITSRCLVGELVFNRRTLLELRSPGSVTHGEVPISARAFCPQ
jgi:hypothetical protein